MSFTIRLTPPARRALAEKLSSAVAVAAGEFISSGLADDPRRVGKPLGAPYEGVYAARRGSYRILYRIDDDARVVTVVDIRHRRDAYRPA